MTEDRLLEIARALGASIEPIGDIWRMTYQDGTTQDFTFEEAANIIAEEVAKSPPPGWDSYLQQSKEGIASIFGQWPPLKREEVKTQTGTEWKPIPIEKGGFDWDFFDSFNAWIIQQEGRVGEAPQYYTGDNAWEEANAAAMAATEESGGKQEWEVVGVPGRGPAYGIQPVDPALPPERLLGSRTLESGQLEHTYGYKDAQGNTKITGYEYSAAPGAPASTYLGIRTKINPSTKKPYTFHATGYPDEDAEGGEVYTRVDIIPEEDPERKFLGKQIIDGEEYYAWGYIDSDGNPFVIDATPVPTEDPTETLLGTATDARGRDIEEWGHLDPVTGAKVITDTRVLPTPKDPTQKYLGRDTDDQGREVDLYGYYDPKTRRNVITGREYLQDIEPDEVFLGTVDDGGWRIDQYGYIDPDTSRPVVTRRQAREPIRDPILSVDDMIAQALGKVDDWSDLGDLNLQRAQSLFDFKRQPTDAERLRIAMDIAQSPSDYMTLVGLYTGAISRESPARAGERIAPLAPYLQQMAQKFFLDVPGINEMAPRRQPAQPAAAAAAPSVTPAAPPTITQPSLGDVTTTPEFGFDPATAESSLPFYYQHLVSPMNVPDAATQPTIGETIQLPTGLDAATAGSFQPAAGETTQVSTGFDMAAAKAPATKTAPLLSKYGQSGFIDMPGELLAQMPTPFDAEQAALKAQGLAYMTGRWTGGTQAEWEDPRMTEEERDKIWDIAFEGGDEWAQGTTFVPTPGWKPEERKTAAQLTSPETMASNEAFFALAPEEQQQKQLEWGGSFQEGGVVPGDYGERKIIEVESGEIVIPNSIQGKGMLPEYGVWRPPSREFSRQVVQPTTQGLIPSLKESAIRFRSPQTIRYMTPTQRMMFQADVERTFDRVPYEDWRMQEMLSTGAGGSGRPRIQFRRPSFVRG